MKVYVRAPYSKESLDELNDLFEEVIYDPRNTDGERYYEDEMLQKLLKIKPDILITELDKITQKVLDGYDKLKVIGDCRANPANIDVDICTKKNIPILCTPQRNAEAVAEMVIGLVIYKLRHIGDSIKWIKEDKRVEGTTPYFIWMGNEILGAKVGIVGLGAVGKRLGILFKAFGAEVSFYDPYIDQFEDFKKKDIKEIFKDSDIVSLHLPVNNETKNMIDKKLFDLMKSNSILVNTSRSQVINEEDLLELAKNKKIGGIILDVLENEPPTDKDLLINNYENVIITPHIAGATHEVTNHQSKILNERLKKWINKEDLHEIVYNKEVLK